jgi:hypothetical protein
MMLCKNCGRVLTKKMLLTAAAMIQVSRRQDRSVSVIPRCPACGHAIGRRAILSWVARYNARLGHSRRGAKERRCRWGCGKRGPAHRIAVHELACRLRSKRGRPSVRRPCAYCRRPLPVAVLRLHEPRCTKNPNRLVEVRR